MPLFKKKKEKEESSAKDDAPVAPDQQLLNSLTPEQRHIIESQVEQLPTKTVSIVQIFRFATPLEIATNALGLVLAAGSGAAQPLMALIFGNTTTKFTDFGQSTSTALPTAAPLGPIKDELIHQANKQILALVYLSVAAFVCHYISNLVWNYNGERITKRIRQKYLDAVLHQNMAFFDSIGAGEVTNRIEVDTNTIQTGISDRVPQVVTLLSTFFAGFAVAIARNWRLSLPVATLIPAVAVVGGSGAVILSKGEKFIREETAKGATLAEEIISSVRNVFAFSTERRLSDMYEVFNKKATDKKTQLSFPMSAIFSLAISPVYAAYALAFWYGTTLYLRGHARSGDIFTAIFSIVTATFSLATCTMFVVNIHSALGAAGNLFAVIDRKPTVDSKSDEGLKIRLGVAEKDWEAGKREFEMAGEQKPSGEKEQFNDKEHAPAYDEKRGVSEARLASATAPDQAESVPTALASPTGSPRSDSLGFISLRNVNFIYPSRTNVRVLTDFSADIPRGKTTALVGPSGCGKSTIISILERFYLPYSGSVTIEGHALEDYNVKHLRSQMGLVSQEPTLFSTSVLRNILDGLSAEQRKILSPQQQRTLAIEASTQASAHDFISTLPDGYDTLIGERGMLLSGGQKQRIAIARATISDPPILLLDEATSALDTKSESIVQQALERAQQGRTTIVIAHRLSTIRNADQIIVMQEGRVTERALGNATASAHHQLLQNTEGLYARLVAAQTFEESTDTPVVEKPEKACFEDLATVLTAKSDEASWEMDIESQDVAQAREGFITAIYRMLRFNMKHNPSTRLLYLAGACGSLTLGSCFPVIGIIFGNLFGVFSSTDTDYIRQRGSRLALYAFIVSICNFLGFLFHEGAFRTGAAALGGTIRTITLRALLRKPVKFYDMEVNNVGHLTTLISNNADKITDFIGEALGGIVSSLVTLLAASIIALCYSWRIALVGIACYPLTVSSGYLRFLVLVRGVERNKNNHSGSAQMACEAAAGIRTVASLTQENAYVQRYADELEAPMKALGRTLLFTSALFASSQSLVLFTMALLFWFGSHQLVKGHVTISHFFIVLLNVVFGATEAGNVFLYSPDMNGFDSVAHEFLALKDSLASDKERSELFDPNPRFSDEFPVAGHVVFNNVFFRYPSRQHVPVLNGMSFEVKPGQYVALVGPSGCGKTTAIQLIERFYRPSRGTVTLDGRDIQDFHTMDYRRHLAIVSQEPTLYNASVRENVRLGAQPGQEVSDADVETACKEANIHNFIISLPDGYETLVGGKGSHLSGGQKQRIAIARALVRHPKVLLLDEATSALDSESERVVQEALDSAAKGRSTISIAHRLTSIQKADVIYVVDKGRIVEKGNHQELMARKGAYYALAIQQNLA